MSLARYSVISVDWADEVPLEVLAHSSHDACEEWCDVQQRWGNFTDGYPDGHELRVLGPEGGETLHFVYTEYEPSFHVCSKQEKT